MQSSRARIGIIGVAVIAAVVLFLVLSGGDGGDDVERPVASEPPGSGASVSGSGGGGGEPVLEPPVEEGSPDPTIRIRGGEPVDGVAELDYAKGDQARFQVRSDVADEVHVHGYDIIKNVEAGGSVSFDFQADIDGLFEVELESTHTQIAKLRVEP